MWDLCPGIVSKGTAAEEYFHQSNDSIRQRIWTERIEPYIDEPVYEVRIHIFQPQPVQRQQLV